jgi:hypothetical protein
VTQFRSRKENFSFFFLWGPSCTPTYFLLNLWTQRAYSILINVFTKIALFLSCIRFSYSLMIASVKTAGRNQRSRSGPAQDWSSVSFNFIGQAKQGFGLEKNYSPKALIHRYLYNERYQSNQNKKRSLCNFIPNPMLILLLFLFFFLIFYLFLHHFLIISSHSPVKHDFLMFLLFLAFHLTLCVHFCLLIQPNFYFCFLFVHSAKLAL